MRFQDIFNGNIYLYARVSTDRQVTDRQIEGGLKWFADRGVPKEDVIILEEKISSGTTLAKRKLWLLLNGQITKDGKVDLELEGSNKERNDFIFFENLDRISRGTGADGLSILEHVERYLNTTLFSQHDAFWFSGRELPSESITYVGAEKDKEVLKLWTTIMGAVYSFARRGANKRTSETIRLNQQRGLNHGSIKGKFRTKRRRIEEVVALHNASQLSRRQISRLTKVSELTVQYLLQDITGTTPKSSNIEKCAPISPETLKAFYKRQDDLDKQRIQKKK